MRIVTARPNVTSPEVVEASTSTLGEGEVRVRVAAAAVNPVDQQVLDGVFAGVLAPMERYTLGWDLAGEVLEVSGEGRLRPGDAVIGLIDWFATYPATGTQGDEVVVLERYLVPAPSSLTPELAATLPLNAVTAAQALDLLELPRGATLVITGAAGAVGGFAMELAVDRGLRVLAVAREGDRLWLEKRGATAIVAEGELSTAVRRVASAGADGLMDAAAMGQSAIAAVRDGGRFVILRGTSEVDSERNIAVLREVVSSDADLLSALAAQADDRVLTPRVAEVVPLAEAARGYDLAKRSGLRGKVVLVP